METVFSAARAIPHMIIANHGPVHEIHKLLETREVGIFYSRLKPRGVLPLEVHKFVEVIYRLRGRTRMKIGDRDFVVGPGEHAIVPAGVWHQSTSLEDDGEVEQLVLCAYDQEPGSLLTDYLGFQSTEATSQAADGSVYRRLVAVVSGLAPERALEIGEDTAILDRKLAFDSLALVSFFSALESEFGISAGEADAAEWLQLPMRALALRITDTIAAREKADVPG
jgi:quercetin dioxygenase-like cupin family protein/acyl carrier protein